MAARIRLTPREVTFIAVYVAKSDATQAASEAGYGGSRRALAVKGQRLLARPLVAEAIRRQSQALAGRVMNRTERQRLWSDVAEGKVWPDAVPRDRLKASELLARSQADFLDRQQIDVRGETKIVHEHRLLTSQSRPVAALPAADSEAKVGGESASTFAHNSESDEKG